MYVHVYLLLLIQFNKLNAIPYPYVIWITQIQLKPAKTGKYTFIWKYFHNGFCLNKFHPHTLLFSLFKLECSQTLNTRLQALTPGWFGSIRSKTRARKGKGLLIQRKQKVIQRQENHISKACPHTYFIESFRVFSTHALLISYRVLVSFSFLA